MASAWETSDWERNVVGRLRELASVALTDGTSADGGAAPRKRMSALFEWIVRWAGQPLPENWKRYSIAVAAVLTATFVRSLLDPWMGDAAPHACFLVATTFVAWRCGLGPALISIVLGALAATYFFVQPRGTLIHIAEADSRISLGSSLVVSLAISLLSESLRTVAAENARLYALARQADRRKDEFLAMLSHELRNPLVPIRNALFVLKAKGTLDPDLLAARELMQVQIEHLVRMVDDLLDVSRVSRGVIELRREPTLLAEVIRPAVDIAQPLIAEKEQRLTLSLTAQPVYANADRIRLTQALANLLNNAARYTEQGGQIWLATEVKDGTFILRVRDSGIGIEPDMLEKIFDLFQQGHSAGTYAQGGLGIGLTLARNLIEMHGGSVEATSPGLGQGSEFIVRLPTTSVPQASRRLPARTAEPAAGRRVLVVDDSQPSAESMARVLRLLGHDVQVSFDAASALEQARTFRPEVVLSDVSLPGMDGYRLATELRRMPGLGAVMLVAVTGHGQSEDRKRALESGFDLHMLKPINPDELAQLLAPS
jgi:signal transduction histidine kinase